MKKVIKVTCKAADLLDPDTVEEFQGNLKEMSKDSFEKMKRSLERHGFTAPCLVWRNGKEVKVLDAHQRLRVLRAMLADGYTLEGGKVPVAYIDAATEKEAKEKILVFASQYGRATDEGLYEFISVNNLDFATLATEVALPSINIDLFARSYFVDTPLDADLARPTFGADGKKAAPDEKYFYVEYYGDEARFAKLKKMLADHMTSAHEVDGKFFFNMVKEAVRAKTK
jgi:hypothetical protein